MRLMMTKDRRVIFEMEAVAPELLTNPSEEVWDAIINELISSGNLIEDASGHLCPPWLSTSHPDVGCPYCVDAFRYAGEYFARRFGLKPVTLDPDWQRIA
jgi:hypothetical protein